MRDAVKRFWSHVEKTDGCWLWTAAVRSKTAPYPIFSLDGKSVSAHRFSYELHYGKIPVGLNVCHDCDTPRCIRPDHLKAATQKKNIDDMVSRGRNKDRSGEKNGQSVLTLVEVGEIREAIKTAPRKYGFYSQLSKRFGVSVPTISMIASGQRWGGIKC